jgi:uncharacterized protein YcbK (DUF882 family)
LRKHLRTCAAGALALGLAAVFGASMIRAGVETERRIELHNIHNGEDISIVYKKDGQYVPDALEKLNWFLRDWRANKATKMDPHTIDLVWEIHQELGSKVPIHFVSGYRSPSTNESLRRAGGGQAKHSQHILGKAMDVAFPDVPVQKLRYAGLVREAGGVGYYPTSGVPFVHIDTGQVRMWPRMPRYELALLFPKGHSKFVPDDGRPISVADVGYARAHFTQMADAIAAFHQFRAEPKDRTMVASLEPAVPASQTSEPDATASATPLPAPGAKSQIVALLEADAALSPATSLALAKPAPIAAKHSPVVVKRSKPVIASVVVASLTDIVPPRPSAAARPEAPKTAGLTPESADRMDQVTPPTPVQVSANDAFMNQSGWVQAPDYDEDHDSELSYRPFPLGDLIDRTPSIDNPVLAHLSKPDLAAAHDSIGNNEELQMRFRPNLKVAELLVADSFSGHDPMQDLFAQAATRSKTSGRIVKTASRN